MLLSYPTRRSSDLQRGLHLGEDHLIDVGHRLAIQVLEVVVERGGDTVAQGLGLVGRGLSQRGMALARVGLIVHWIGGGVDRRIVHATWSSSGKWSNRRRRASS